MEQILADIIGFLRAVGPEVVFFVTLAETAFFIGLVVPAEATVLVAAFFVAEGAFALEHVVIATVGGAFLGDQIGYALGRFGGRRFAARGGRFGRLWARSEPKATAMFRGHPIVAVSLARFVSFVRTVMPWFAGMSHMPYGRFAFFDALGVIGWGSASILAGYLAGESWDVLADALGTVSAIIVGILLVVLVVLIVRARRAARDQGQGNEPAAADPPPAGTAIDADVPPPDPSA